MAGGPGQSLQTLFGPAGAGDLAETAMDVVQAAALQRSAGIVKAALGAVA